MTRLVLSFEKQNLRLGNDWLFKRTQVMRFEWLALLGVKRLMAPGDQASVTLEEIARLPSWKGKNRRHVGTNIGRYLQSLERQCPELVSAETRWAGPYRLNLNALSVSFDIQPSEVRRRLQLRPLTSSATKRDVLLRYVGSYVRARWLLFRGFLIDSTPGNNRDTAYERLMRMAANRSYGSTLRLLACLAAVEVLYRLGRIQAGRLTLLDNTNLVRATPDLALKARFYIKLAWAHQRGSTGKRSDRGVEAALAKANSFAERSGDRAALGQLAARAGGYLTKKRRHLEAVNEMVLALEAFLITADYDNVQATCGNIGSVLHRLGPRAYAEARRWLLLSIGIAKLMNLGRDDAHAEMILGKIYLETDKKVRSQRLLHRAERIAKRAGNRINLADINMVWGLWHQRFGSRRKLVDALVNALSIFRSLKEFDTAQKEKYMESSFPDVWPDVIASVNNRLTAGISLADGIASNP